MLISGIRKNEGITAFNRIIEFSKQNKLNEYYNSELNILEHYKQKDNTNNFIYLKATKKLYISIINQNLINEISHSQPVSYSAIANE